MRKRYVLYISFLLTIILFPSDVFAQGSTQWELPHRARARYGKGWINDLTFSPDGTKLAVATTIGIWIYDVLTGREVKLLTGEMKGANAISYSPEGNILAGAHSDRTVRLWNVSSGEQKLLPILSEHTKAIYAIDFSADGRMLASGSEDNTIRVCNIHTEELLSILPGSQDAVYTVAFAPDNRMSDVPANNSILAGGSGDGIIRIWDAGTGNLMHELNKHEKSVVELDFSPDGKSLVSASLDRTIQLWDLVGPETNRSTPTQYNTAVYTVDFSPDGHTLATGTADQLIRVWRINDQELIHTFRGHTDSVWTVELSPNDNLLASGSLDGTVRLWDTRFSALRATITGHTGGVKALAYVEDNRIRTCGTGLDDKLRLWDAGTGRQLAILREHRGLTESVAFSKDGKTLVSGGSKNGTIFLSDVSRALNVSGSFRDDISLSTFTGNAQGITALALSPEGSILASGGKDGRIHLLDVATRTDMKILRGAESTVTALAFAPDGTILLSGEENGTVRSWNAHSGEALDADDTFSKTTIPITALAFSSSARYRAIGNATGKILLLDTDTNGETSISTKHSRKITALIFSEDDTTLVSGSDDGTILLWDMDEARLNTEEQDMSSRQDQPNTEITGEQQTVTTQTPQEIAKRALASTVLVATLDANGESLGYGSGFFAHPRYIATNHHVIKQASQTYFKLVGQETTYWIDDVVAIDPAHDLALLRVSSLNVPALPLANSDTVQIGENVFAVGNPQGLEGTVSNGIISSIRGETDNKWIQITAAISPGSSGGAVLNSKGEVIGIATLAYFSIDPKLKVNRSQNLNFAVPSNYLNALLRRLE